MARKIHTRWKINAILKAVTPIHVGGMGGDADTDLALAVNGRGCYYIPGTSLAGAFRGWMQSYSADENNVKQVWGFQDQDGNGHASFLVIDDAEVQLKDGETIEIREGVGINRDTGAAAEHCKYSRAILPKGIRFPVSITLDCQETNDPSALWQLLQAVEHGDIRIGAAKTRGLGRVELEDLTIHQQNLSDADGIFNTLLSGGDQIDWKDIKANVSYNPPSHLDLNIAWMPRDPVMVKAEGDGIAVDMLPLVSQVGSGVRFVIPGSSIKGVFRAHAERIVRTVCNCPKSEKFLEQVDLKLVNELFGSASKGDKDKVQKKKGKVDDTKFHDQLFGSASKGDKDKGYIGCLAIDDCYATIPIKTSHWSAVENATKATDDLKKALSTALNSSDTPFKTLQPAMHVAIDRWTGGAADGMLYSVLEPIGVTWEAIGLRLDLERLQKYNADLVKPAIALLLLVLRDFANRKIPIGYGTNRGMGTVAVTAMMLNAKNVRDLLALDGELAVTPDLSSLGNELLSDLTKAWQDWIAQSPNQKAAS